MHSLVIVLAPNLGCRYYDVYNTSPTKICNSLCISLLIRSPTWFRFVILIPWLRINDVEKFSPSLWICVKDTPHATSHSLCPYLLHPPHHHAKMTTFDYHSHPHWLNGLFQGIDNFASETSFPEDCRCKNVSLAKLSIPWKRPFNQWGWEW